MLYVQLLFKFFALGNQISQLGRFKLLRIFTDTDERCLLEMVFIVPSSGLVVHRANAAWPFSL